MIRDDEFRISRRPYAVDLDSFRATTRTISGDRFGPERQIHSVAIDAVWFRRRPGITVAVLGSLWNSMKDPPPADVHEALARMRDGRYGGRWVARWDGRSYASEVPQDADAIARHLAILRPMLDGYPAVPPRFDGWWRYPTGAENVAAAEAARAPRADGGERRG